MRHPDHDCLVEIVRAWYTCSYPEMGYHREQRRFGYYSRNLRALYNATNQVTIRGLAPGQVPEFLADVRKYYGNRPVRIWVDDRQTDAELGPALLAAGCSRGDAEIFLAHVGPAPRAPSVPGLTTEAVTPANLVEYVVTKLKGFANSEVEPTPDAVRAELALRRAELAGEGRFLLARIRGEPAGIIGWYEGWDRFIFQLATRVPFRRRGIAKWLLCHVLADGYAQGCRSVIISADPNDAPIQFYRRLGFTDEIYWRQRYQLRADGA